MKLRGFVFSLASLAGLLSIFGQGRAPRSETKRSHDLALTTPVSGELAPAKNRPLASAYGKLPLSFEANQGQTDRRVKFLSRGSGYSLFLTPTEAVLTLGSSSPESKVKDQKPEAEGAGLLSRPAAANEFPKKRSATDLQHKSALRQTVLRMKLAGANPAPKVLGVDELPSKSNYFIGNDPKRWRTNVPIYAKVKYEGVYPGVDLIFYGNQQRLEYDFVVAPGVDPLSITFGLEGSQKLTLDAKGNLVIAVDGGEVHFGKPAIYQESDGFRREIVGGYVLKNARRVNFQVGSYDHSRSLVIDPPLVYSTYLGGSGFDLGRSIAVDSAGNAYVTGLAGSANFPTTAGALNTTLGGGFDDAFVTKLNPQGNALVYSTYLGGSGDDEGRGIAVDPSGNAYVTGLTESADFPTTPGAFQTTNGGVRNAFVTKLNSQGDGLLYSSYLGGSNSGGFFGTYGNAIALDSAGDAYVTGGTSSTNFPTTPGTFQTAFGGSPGDAFVTKMNPAGTALVYSTYVGGAAADLGAGIAVDSAGNAYVTGCTASTNFPTTPGAFQTTFGGKRDAFVAELNSGGSALVYSTYLGGANDDGGGGVAVDSAGNAYVTGFTESTNFPTTAGAFQTASGGFGDAFVTKLNPTGSALGYSTYLGGSNFDLGLGIAADAAGNAYVTGQTNSTNFPTTAGAFQTTLSVGFCGDPPFTSPCSDAFVTKLNPTGTALSYSTYLGGSGDDFGSRIAVNPAGDAYVAGSTASTNFPTTTGAFQTTLGGGSPDAVNAFVTRISPPPDFSLSTSPSSQTVSVGASTTYTVNITRTGGFAGAVTFSAAGLPAGAMASLNPNPASGNSSAVTATTTARALLAPWPKLRLPSATFSVRGWPLWAIGPLVLGLLARRTRARCHVPQLVFATAVFAVLLCIGCGGSTGGGGPGGGGGGTPPGTSVLTITGTSGSLTHTTTVTLVVN